MTDEGKLLAKTLASFVRRMPCKVVISESCCVSRDGRPERALALARHLTEELGVPEDVLSIAAPAENGKSGWGVPTMVVTMITGGLYQ